MPPTQLPTRKTRRKRTARGSRSKVALAVSVDGSGAWVVVGLNREPVDCFCLMQEESDSCGDGSGARVVADLNRGPVDCFCLTPEESDSCGDGGKVSKTLCFDRGAEAALVRLLVPRRIPSLSAFSFFFFPHACA